MLIAYFGVLAWQIIWHALLPPPWGAQNIWLALFACLPLLIPVAGLLRRSYKSMILAGVLLRFYFTIGVMEIWVSPPHRIPATVQIVLAILYLFAFRKRNQANSAD